MKDEAGRAEVRPQDLKARTRAFALRVIRLCESLPNSAPGRVISNQMLRAGTSVGVHYREATRARSTAEFVSKLEGGLQELEETMYWMELVTEANLLPTSRLADLAAEADELTAILVSCVRSAKAKTGATKECKQ